MQASDPTTKSEEGSGCGPFLFFAIIIIVCSILASNSDKSPPSDEPSITPRSEPVPPPPDALTPVIPDDRRKFVTPKPLEIEPEKDTRTEEGINQDEGHDTQIEDNESVTPEGPQVPTEPIRNDTMLPINVRGSLEDICVNATSLVLREIINKGIEDQPVYRIYSYPARGTTGQGWSTTTYAIGLEGRNSDVDPSPQTTSLLSDTRLLYQYSRQILDNCDVYSSVEFGLWSTDKWTKFSM